MVVFEFHPSTGSITESLPLVEASSQRRWGWLGKMSPLQPGESIQIISPQTQISFPLLPYCSSPICPHSVRRILNIHSSRRAISKDMLDPITAVGALANAVQLTDAALRASRQVYDFLHAVKNARRDIRILRDCKRIAQVFSCPSTANFNSL